MIKQIFKIIWVERKINIWILLELILIFSILWFCSDYLFFMTDRYLQPRGFDINHTYNINVEMSREGIKNIDSGDQEAKDKILEDIWTIYERIKRYPAVEYVCYSNAAHPYSRTYSEGPIMIDSTEVAVQIKKVTPEFFDVFKIKVLSGSPFTWENIIAGNTVVISAGKDGLFGGKKAENVKDIVRDNRGKDFKDNVVGTVSRTKRDDFENYIPVIYYPIKKDDAMIGRFRSISVRVRPEADKNFSEQFMKDMRSQLELGYYHLSSVTSLEESRQSYVESRYSDDFKRMYSIYTFLIFNIFLGIIGTFWFRVQARRGEIGLRIAMGSSRSGVKRIFIMETFLLLFLASLVATVICINISLTDIVKDIGMPIPDREDELVNISQHFINYGITFAFIALIAFVAVWYPANKAAKIQPAEALKDE